MLKFGKNKSKLPKRQNWNNMFKKILDDEICVHPSRLHPDLWKRNGFEMYFNMMGLAGRPSVSESGVQSWSILCKKKERDGGIMYVHDMCQFSPDSRRPDRSWRIKMDGDRYVCTTSDSYYKESRTTNPSKNAKLLCVRQSASCLLVTNLISLKPKICPTRTETDKMHVWMNPPTPPPLLSASHSVYLITTTKHKLFRLLQTVKS